MSTRARRNVAPRCGAHADPDSRPRHPPRRSPWNYYRSSGDIRASYDAVVGNLQTTIQWAKAGLSYPGCWAYPDMLEVRYC